jgi:hypothetical protein
MPTNIHARIGYELSSGEVISVYNHRQGTPDFLGTSLKQKYNSIEDVDQLMSGGDLDVIESPVDWNDSPASPSIPLRYRDRGDNNVDCEQHLTADEFLSTTLTEVGSYAYLYTNHYSSDGSYRWVYFSVPESIPADDQITDHVQWTFVD